MIVVRVSLLAPPACSPRLSGQLVEDLVWLHVTPSDQVEHIRVQASPTGFTIVWFMLSDGPQTAEARARRICRRTVTACPVLADWQVA